MSHEKTSEPRHLARRSSSEVETQPQNAHSKSNKEKIAEILWKRRHGRHVGATAILMTEAREHETIRVPWRKQSVMLADVCSVIGGESQEVAFSAMQQETLPIVRDGRQVLSVAIIRSDAEKDWKTQDSVQIRSSFLGPVPVGQPVILSGHGTAEYGGQKVAVHETTEIVHFAPDSALDYGAVLGGVSDVYPRAGSFGLNRLAAVHVHDICRTDYRSATAVDDTIRLLTQMPDPQLRAYFDAVTRG